MDVLSFSLGVTSRTGLNLEQVPAKSAVLRQRHLQAVGYRITTMNLLPDVPHEHTERPGRVDTTLWTKIYATVLPKLEIVIASLHIQTRNIENIGRGSNDRHETKGNIDTKGK
jgi:hypothetical protein